MNFALKPYQRLMADHLLTHDRAAAFVGLGLGKTATTLHCLNELSLDGACKAALIVAPLRVARLTWPNELAKWDQFRWMKHEILFGRPRTKADIYLINYEQLQNLHSLDFCDTVVFDELTRAKNHQSKRIAALRPLLRGHRRWGLTGTPRPNSLLELFAQIRLLDDGQRLGKSYPQFRERWFRPIDYDEYNWEPKEGSEAEIYGRIADLSITLRSSDHLNVPDTVVEDVEMALPDDARAAYKKLEDELLVRIREKDVTAVNAAVLVNKLLQVTGGTVYSETREVVQVHDAKLRALEKIVARHKGESVLIACNYIHERERVCAAVGATDASKFRGDIETAWNTRRVKILAADPRSLGHGLNLQAGGRVIVWFSPTWSRELYDQFNARLARMGQEQVPVVYRLICTGTADEAVIEALHEKGEGQASMLSVLTNLQQLASSR